MMAKILLKYASRGRPALFKETLHKWVDMLSGMHEVHIIVSVDDDDWKMQTGEVRMAMSDVEGEKVSLSFYTGKHTTKIDAINRDMDKCTEWDLLIVVSDDMVPVVRRYDERIIDDMRAHFPDFDGALHYNDGKTQHQLFTLSIMGKKLYDRFGYIYYPEYKSLWCDNEFMEVVKRWKKYWYCPHCIIEHQWKRHGDDIIYQNSECNSSVDQALYSFRLKEGFPEWSEKQK